MGGVTTGADAAALMQAGADAAGIGSAFARVQQQDWAAYIAGVRADAAEALGIAESGRKGTSIRTNSVDHLLSQERQMDYRPYTVQSVTFHSRDIFLLTLNGSCSYSAGEYVFLWLPGTGEKPFSIAEAEPLTFVIKRKGAFTEAAAGLSPGDTLYMRGLYGAPAELTKRTSAVLIAGGTGIAVLPALAGKLREQGTAVSIFYGASDDMETAPLQERLSRFGAFSAVPDAGKPGRVLDSVSAFLSEHASGWENPAVYAVGPEIFMKKAAEMSVQAGIVPEDIFLSLEKPSLCGIGMCGACSCGGRLTCQYGTFLRYDFLKEHADEFRTDTAD
jgi:dihydroorotate dehydrogenase (NAD+) catalytic subunit